MVTQFILTALGVLIIFGIMGLILCAGGHHKGGGSQSWP